MAILCGFADFMKKANADAFALPPEMMTKGKDLHLLGHTIHWSGWMQWPDIDEMRSYWVAYSRPPGRERSVVAPCFSTVYEYKEGEIIKFDGAVSSSLSCVEDNATGLRYHMSRLNFERFCEIANYEKRGSLFRLLNYLGIPEMLADAISMEQHTHIQYDPRDPVPIPYYADDPSTEPIDGEIICPADGTKLNRSDANCWRCGFVF